MPRGRSREGPFGARAPRRAGLQVIEGHVEEVEVAQFRRIARVRRRFEELLAGELEAGVEGGAFEVPELEATTLAILSLCIDLARWYRPSERTT